MEAKSRALGVSNLSPRTLLLQRHPWCEYLWVKYTSTLHKSAARVCVRRRAVPWILDRDARAWARDTHREHSYFCHKGRLYLLLYIIYSVMQCTHSTTSRCTYYIIYVCVVHIIARERCFLHCALLRYCASEVMRRTGLLLLVVYIYFYIHTRPSQPS